MSLDIEAIEARANACSKGTWISCWANQPKPCFCGLVWDTAADSVICTVNHKDDSGEWDEATYDAHMKFIAAARQDIPLLIARVRELEAQLEGKGA